MTYETTEGGYAAPPPPPGEASLRSPKLRRRTLMAITSISLVAGGLAGGFVVSRAATTAATPSASANTGSGSSSSSGSSATAPVFHPNEGSTHEAGESAQREAQENAGQVPTVP